MTKWIVCSAWPYLDGRPHLGTFIHLISADVYARYLRLLRRDTVSVSGSDEHGTPMEVEALKAGLPPERLAEKYHQEMLGLLKSYMIELDNYTKTESAVHVDFVREFYKGVEENGYVHSSMEEQLYCEQDSRFLPDRFVEGTCPHCKADAARGDQCDACGRLLEPLELVNPRCVVCGRRPVPRKSRHWFFDLPKLSDGLDAYIHGNANLPANARNMSLSWLKEGLQARALTRDNKWGIQAPFDGAEGKKIYVWMEAVLGYVSAVKELGERRGEALVESFWKDKDTRSVFFIGKDNILFHTIIFPALLMASREGYTLPWQVSSTEFILFDGKKFSKSKRIGVWMDEALKVAPAEYWRFAMMYLRPELRDANFTWPDFDRIANGELNDVLGNFIHRVLTFVKRFFDLSVPPCGGLDAETSSMLAEIESRWGEYVRNMDSFRIRDALKSMVELSRKGNEFISTKQPWNLVKTEKDAAATVVHVGVQAVYTLAVMMYPFMPAAAGNLRAMLGLEGDPVGAGASGAGSGAALPAGHKILPPSPLFNKVAVPGA
ncbi:MAG: methionine--tRNA ligase [Nitrososphaerota archaeon]|nr:methionine--tRNA ligase [Nitrososphaerota archaeon]